MRQLFTVSSSVNALMKSQAPTGMLCSYTYVCGEGKQDREIMKGSCCLWLLRDAALVWTSCLKLTSTVVSIRVVCWNQQKKELLAWASKFGLVRFWMRWQLCRKKTKPSNRTELV